MYLHLGGDIVIRLCEIVGIFDIENATVGKVGKGFLTAAQKSGSVVNVASASNAPADLPKSFVVCERGGERTVYITQISSATLLRRTNDLDRHNFMG